MPSTASPPAVNSNSSNHIQPQAPSNPITSLQATSQSQSQQCEAKPNSQAKSKSKSKSKSHSYISANEIDRLSTIFLNPNFKPPRRPRIPSPPSLRASLLPPPCAEIDERPRWRVRRLVLWRDRVPALRLAVLDPRRRVHLKRFQGFVTPEDPQFFRGVRSVSGVLRSPTGPTLQDPGPTMTSTTDHTIRPVRQSITPYPSPPPSPGPDARSRVIDLPPEIPTTSNPTTATATAIPTSNPASPTTPPSSSPTSVVLGRVTPPRPPRVKSTILSRKLARARTLQHSLILHREEEKRWRSAMGMLVAGMQEFVRSSTCVLPGTKKLRWIRPIQIPQIQKNIKLMKDIRSSSKNLWTHLPKFPHLNSGTGFIVPSRVKGLKEAKGKVKGLEEREERKRAKKEARRLLVVNGYDTTTKTDLPVIPRKAGVKMKPEDKLKSEVKVAVRARVTPVTVITRQPQSPDPISHSRTLSLVHQGASASVATTDSRRSPQPRPQSEPQARSQSQSSESDRIVTPPTSQTHRHHSPEWTKPHPTPIRPESSASSRSIRTPKLSFKSENETGGMPDEIAQHLAQMLMAFKRPAGGDGHERQRYLAARSDHDGDWTARSDRSGRVEQERPRPSLSSEQDLDTRDNVPDLEVSVYTDESDGSDIDDGIGENTVGGSMEALSYATGELNIDDDTKAAFSGISNV